LIEYVHSPHWPTVNVRTQSEKKSGILNGRPESREALIGYLASVMLHTELHSLEHPENTAPSTRAWFSQMKPSAPPTNDMLDLIEQEIEDMIIEGNVRKEAGPLRSVWEGAIGSGRDNNVTMAKRSRRASY